jgi:hypothetical protein
MVRRLQRGCGVQELAPVERQRDPRSRWVAARLALVAFVVGSWMAAAGLAATQAYASQCPNGSSCAPDAFGPETGSTLLASIGHPYTSQTGAVSGTLTEAVYSNPHNTYCSGCLDFLLQVTNSGNSTASIVRASVSDFGTTLANIGYTTNGAAEPGGLFTNGTVPPGSVDRSSTGSVIGWSFSAIAPGDTTNVLEVQTNATNFIAGEVTVTDGGSTTSSGFAPVAPAVVIPELPWVAGAGLLGGGVAGIVWVRLRRRPGASSARQS